MNMDENKLEVDENIKANQVISRRLKFMKTCSIFLAYFGMGCSIGVLSPTSVDMADLYQCSVQSFVSVTSIKPIGVLSGSLTGAVAADLFQNRADLTIFLCTLINGISLAAMPWMPNLISMGVLVFMNGICLGTFNIVCNFLNLYMWQDKASTPLHLLHMFISVGMASAPLVALPFLSPTAAENNTDLPINSTGYDGHVEVPYAIFGLWSVLVSVIFLVFFIKSTPYVTSSQDGPKRTIQDMFKISNLTGGRTAYALYFILSLFILYFCVNGRDRTISMFLFIIAHTDILQMSKAASAGLVTVGVLSVTAGRGLAGLLSQWFDNRILLIGQLLLGCYIQMLMTFYALSDTTSLWTLTCLLGLVTGSTYSSILAWANRYIKSSGLLLAVIDVGVGLGGCVSLVVGGYLYDEYGSLGVFTLCLLYGVILLTIFVPLQVVAFINGNRYEHVDTSSVFIQNLVDNEQEDIQY